LDVLLAGVVVADTVVSLPASTALSTTTTPSSGMHGTSSLNVGAAIGGALGGIFLVLGAAVFLLLWRRRRRREDEALSGTLFDHDGSSSQIRPWEPVPAAATRTQTGAREMSAGNEPSPMRRKRDVVFLPAAQPAISSSASAFRSAITLVASPDFSQAENAIHSERQPQPAPQAGAELTSNSQAEPGNRNDITIEELVGMLNERLRHGNVVWNEEELPPDYGSGHPGHEH
jgi:hypothetical protein